MSTRPITKQQRNQTHHILDFNHQGYETKVKIERNSFTDTPAYWSINNWISDMTLNREHSLLGFNMMDHMSIWHSEYLKWWKVYQDIN